MDYTIIIKITNSCNLNCKYCYHRSDLTRDFSQVMSKETIEWTIRQLLENNDQYAEFIWHGGEPMLVGIDTFEYIVDMQKKWNKKGIRIKNCIQTNGTLLTEADIKFFKKYDFDIGISIDGPFDMHAGMRGTDTSEYQTILSSIKELNGNGNKFGTLCVVGKSHIGQAERVYNLLCEHHICNIGFLPCLVEKDGVIDKELTISPSEYGQFLIDFFEVWINGDMHGLSERNIDDCIRFYRGKGAKTCISANSCDRYLTVMPDGRIFLCDNFSSCESHQVGDVRTGFDNINIQPAMQWLKHAMEIIPETCKQCSFFEGCYSGCKHRRWVRDQSMKSGHYYCVSTKMLYTHVGKYLNKGVN